MRRYANQYKYMTDEDRNKIIELWQQEMTSGEIALKLGVTRNSVIGVVYRARKNGGLLRKRDIKNIIPKVTKQIKEKIVKEVIKSDKKVKKEKEKKIIEEIFEPISIEDNDTSCAVNMDDLTYYSCRFIIEEGNYETTKYCGKLIDRSSYCKTHYSMCYYPSRFTLEKLLKV